MKLSDFEKLSKSYLLPSMPDYAAKGGIVFLTPIGDLLRGFLYEASAWDNNKFKIMLFVQPLYIQYDTIVLLFSTDIGFESDGREIWWDGCTDVDKTMKSITSKLQTAGKKWLDNFVCPLDIALKGPDISSANDPHVLRAVYYSFIISNAIDEAKKTYTMFNSVLSSVPNKNNWLLDIEKEVCEMQKMLEEDVDVAKATLCEYRKSTIQNLKLNKWAV